MLYITVIYIYLYIYIYCTRLNSARLASIKANARGPFELWPFAGALHSGFSGPCSINSSRAIGKCTENVAVSPAEQAASCIFCSTVPGDTA